MKVQTALTTTVLPPEFEEVPLDQQNLEHDELIMRMIVRKNDILSLARSEFLVGHIASILIPL